MSFNETLRSLLKSDPRFVDQDGDLLKSEVIDKAWKIDRQLIGLLLDNAQIKAKFFDEIKGHWVFNINTFIDYVQDKNFYASSYTKFRNKIGLTIDGKFLKERGEVALVWPYKDCVLEGGQSKEEEKRKEIFFNEVLAQDEIDRLLDPKVLTSFKRYTVNGEEKVTEFKRDKDGTIRENLIIKGNNLLALHSLKEQFREKVKLIYIDPPYNTGNDSFGYNDNFNHSTWLTFIKNRLEIAKTLLRPDGSIWINIDDSEDHYLKIICDEIFDRSNFIGCIIWQHSIQGKGYSGNLSVHHNYILCYRKSERFNLGLLERTEEHNTNYSNPDHDPKGDWRTGDIRNALYRPNLIYDIVTPSGKIIHPPKNGWRFSKETMIKKIRDKSVIFNKDETRLILKIYLSDQEGRVPESIWFGKDIGTTRIANKEIKELFGDKVFDTPKPEALLNRIIDISMNINEIFLDFFIGSGTSISVSHKMNIQYIGIEQMSYMKDLPVERLNKVVGKNIKKDGKLLEELEYDQSGISKAVNWKGGGDFIYCELMKYNEAFIERIRNAKDTKAILAIWEEMKIRSFLNYNVDINRMDANIAEFKELSLAKQKEVLMDILNKNQLYVNLTEIDDQDFKVSEEDKKLNKLFYEG
ncbi:site-specific DNA-methyltransferase [bacterium]|nr:site-specific DNA-methyltransferase [bacterium]